MDSLVFNIISMLLVGVLLYALVNIRRQNRAIAGLLQKKSDQLQVSAEELRLLATTFNSHEPILITDANLEVLRVNEAFTKVTGHARRDVLGKKATRFAVGDSGETHDEIQLSLANDGHYSGEVSSWHKDGTRMPMHLRVTAIKDENEGTSHYVAVYSDISEQKRSQEAINQLAFYDPLTGLPNRRQIMEQLGRELSHAERYGSSGALFFLDIDNFKDINDTLGHDHGDCLLVELGNRLQRNVRRSDVVSRLGGDEFVVLLQCGSMAEEDTLEHANDVREKILALAEQPYIIDGHKHHVSISVGISIFPGNATSPQDLLKQADTAMYNAKSTGKNTACFFHPRMQEEAARKVAMARDLRDAMERDQLNLQFQPQVNGNGSVRSVEALLRWNREGTAVSPAEFIPIAEHTGMIVPIGNFVLERSCQQMQQWLEQGLTLDHISVNVSPRQFLDSDFVPNLQRTLQATQLPAANLMLELTESVVVENMEEAKSKMEAINALGVRISMDDFGTGYSSLSYLSELPFYELKIDQTFVHNLFNGGKNSAIATAIIAMAESLDLKVLAEGVENSEQLEFLREHHCGMFQGYFFSRPVDADSVHDMLVEQKSAEKARAETRRSGAPRSLRLPALVEPRFSTGNVIA